MATTESYSDAESITIIDKLASYVARNGADFEAMVKQKEANNPRFAFLFGGPHQQYYLNKLAEEKASMHDSSASARPLLTAPTSVTNPLSVTGLSLASSNLPQMPATTSSVGNHYIPHASSGHSVPGVGYPTPSVQTPHLRQSRFDQGGYPTNAAPTQQQPTHGQHSQYPPPVIHNSPGLQAQLPYGGDVASDRWPRQDYYYENPQAYNEAAAETSAGSQELAERFEPDAYDRNASQYHSQQYDYAAEHQRWSEHQYAQQYPEQQAPWNNSIPPSHGYPGYPLPAGAFPRHTGLPPFHGGFPPPLFFQRALGPPLPESMRPPGPEPPFVLPRQYGSLPPASESNNAAPTSLSAPPPVRPRWAAPPPPVVRKTPTDSVRTPGGLPAIPAVPPGPPRPWWELPAGIFVDLVPKSAIDYVPLEPEQVVMPTPKPITPDLLSALEQFYDPPQPDRPRNAEGWEKLALFEHFKMKESYKKKRADVKELAHQDDLIAKARQAAKELAAKAAISLKPSSVSN